ncbi:MAG: hypothetical protein IT434_08715 [Phycisphaerales bacterium]|jgi:hypothetical protein|nr:hypothetical protein [Phycisphaerales bacterium]
MGLGGSILTKYDNGPSEPQRPPSGKPVLIVGLVVFGGLFAAGLAAIEGRQACIALTIVHSIVLAIAQMVVGWRRDGLVGLLFSMRFPLGLALFEERAVTPRERAYRWVWWIAIGASVGLILLRGWPF